MFRSISDAIYTFFTDYSEVEEEEEEDDMICEHQQATNELVDALGELLYTIQYSPSVKIIEEVAREKYTHFHPLFACQKMKENNKRKLDALIQSHILTSNRKKDPLERKRDRKRVCRQCLSCQRLKSENCFQSELLHDCNACLRRLTFPRKSISNTRSKKIL